MYAYAITYTTESGDIGVWGLTERRLTEGELSAIAARDFPEEILEGVSYVQFQQFKVLEMDIPEAIEPIPTL